MKAEIDKYWTAFYTKPRNEKKAAERLSSQGYEVYCPQRTTLKQWSDRKKKVKEVLFTSYLFAFVNENDRQEMLKDHSIVSSVFWLKKPVRIPSTEIEAIKNLLSEHPSAEISLQTEIGQQLHIKSGPFKGEEGVVQKIKGNRIVLTLSTLGVSLQAEIPMNHLV
jgi:transcription antitermination factor NusG